MFDFNCNITPENKDAYEMLPYVSSANISAGLHNGNPIDILKFANYAVRHEISIGVLIDGDNKEKDEDKISADILYQISAVAGFLNTYGLKIENIRLNGKYYDKLNSDKDFAKIVAKAVQQFNPWLNIIIKNEEIKKYLEDELYSKCALEVDFGKNTSIREIREANTTPETIHFEDIENLKRACDVLKPTPITYNRVSEDF